jgi:sigma-B regulation protein RsbU (phosphoserine phosphatase)
MVLRQPTVAEPAESPSLFSMSGRNVLSAGMDLGDRQLTASQVLRIFHRDEAYLFLGAAFTTVGLVAAAFAVLGRKFNALLTWFALFAFLYGQRLWLQSPLLTLLVPSSIFFAQLQDLGNYVVPIPAFLFFAQAGFLGRRGSRIAYGVIAVFVGLFAGTVVFGDLPLFHLMNNAVIIATLALLLLRWMTLGTKNREFVVVRRGMFVFVVCALCDNLELIFHVYWRIEPFGFAVLLGTLGYVAARRTLDRDRQLGAIQKELDVARQIQMSILPSAYPDSGCFRIGARYVPMMSVAGDFYDFVATGEQQAGILIADVSGHGVPAALIASMVKLAALSQRDNAANPAGLLFGMNQALCGNTQNQFVTAAYVHLDAATETLRYSAAAHPPMLLVRDGVVLEIEENGLMPMGCTRCTPAIASFSIPTAFLRLPTASATSSGESVCMRRYGRVRRPQHSRWQTRSLAWCRPGRRLKMTT